MLTERRVEKCLNTVWCIASSRYVKSFVIGYTARAAHARALEYQGQGFDSLVVLADQLTRSDALGLEEKLQNRCKAGQGRILPYRYKYHPERRLDRYRKSIGSREVHPADARMHSVYMAWEEP
jgi:hypothetical protein